MPIDIQLKSTFRARVPSFENEYTSAPVDDIKLDTVNIKFSLELFAIQVTVTAGVVVYEYVKLIIPKPLPSVAATPKFRIGYGLLLIVLVAKLLVKRVSKLLVIRPGPYVISPVFGS